MKNVLKYPGSKQRIAPWIIEHIPDHKVYLELFFGGGAVFFNKKPARIETINDLSGEVYNYFKVLREHPDELIRLITLTPYCRDEYNKAFEYTTDHIEKARRFAVRCSQGFGCSNNYKNGFRSSISEMSPITTNYWSEFPEVLQQASLRLKDAQIENQDALTLLKRYNKKEVFVYADPPYLLETRKGYLYEHEMTDQQHTELLDSLLKHKGTVMISGYDNGLYNSMLKGWNKAQKNTTAESGIRRTETIWMNYDIQKQLDFEIEAI